MCDKIKKPINKIILGKALPTSQFVSINCYRSEQPSKNLALREGQLQFVIAICNLQFIIYNFLIVNGKG